ncbi:hypothetical protein ABID21_001294 [Pseudorhizobium tarimense]|uniref:Transposase n=1 Tax=Pseudorhizobium tarimense TaxID=1079109 RepID=A0ABV2H3R9_9HYPH
MVAELDDLPEDRNQGTAGALPEDFEREAISLGPRTEALSRASTWTG